MKNFKELEDGGVYKNRCGEKVIVKKRVSDKDEVGGDIDTYPFSGSGSSYNSNGNVFNNFIDSKFDLIEKIWTKNFKELEVGGIYQRMDGVEETIIDYDADREPYPYWTESDLSYMGNGCYRTDNGEEEKTIMEKIGHVTKYPLIKEMEESITQLEVKNIDILLRLEALEEDVQDLIEKVEPIKRNIETKFKNGNKVIKPKFKQWDVVMYEGEKYLFVCYSEKTTDHCIIEKHGGGYSTIIVQISKVTKA